MQKPGVPACAAFDGNLTHYPWGSREGAPEPPLWHHDIFRRDGTPFNAREVEQIRMVTRGVPAESPEYRVLLPTSERKARSWQYTLDRPVGDWFACDFDHSKWKTAPAPFGQDEAGIGRKPNTRWNSSDIWLRSSFDMPAEQFDHYVLNIQYEEAPEVYLNGLLAAKLSGYNADYDQIPLNHQAGAFLKPGRNTIAIHCTQTVGGQYIDVGIQALPLKP